MAILDTPLRSLQMVFDEATVTAAPLVAAFWFDQVSGTGGFVPGNSNTATNGVTPVTIVAAPAANVQRAVNEIRMVNTDTVVHTVTLQLNDNSTIIELDTQSVAPGGVYAYTPDKGVDATAASLTVTDGTHSVAAVALAYFRGALVTNLGGGEAQVQIEELIGPDGALPNGNGVTVRAMPGAGVGTGNGGNFISYGGAASNTGHGGFVYFRGGPASGSGAGGFFGGYGGDNSGTGAGGDWYGRGGNGLAGGLARLNAGYGTNVGGALVLSSGVSGNGAGTDISLNASNAAGASGGAGGDIKFGSGNGLGTAQAGGDFAITLGTPSDAAGRPGQIFVDNDASIMSAFKSWSAAEPLNGRTIVTATRPVMVTAIIGRVDIANGSAATLLVYKAPSGTAFSAGTVLSSTSMDLNGTADTNQTLTLSATLTDLQLAIGDSLGLVESGALSASVGCITVHFTPI